MKGRSEEYCQLQQTFMEAKEQWYKEKDSLKKGSKQVKEKLSQAQSKIDCLSEQLHDVVSAAWIWALHWDTVLISDMFLLLSC